MIGQSKGWGQPRQVVKWRRARCLALICAVSLPLGLPGAAVAKEPLEIGMAAALTGYLANFDGQFIDGAKLAAKRANASGGVDGHRLDLHVLDDASNATTGVTVTNQLLNQFGVSVMLNGLSSAQNTADRADPGAREGAADRVLGAAARSGLGLPRQPAARQGREAAAAISRRTPCMRKRSRSSISQTPYGQAGGKVLGEGAEALGLNGRLFRSESSRPRPT